LKLYRIVLKDLRRRRWRVLYTALGVVIGTMTVVGILTLAQAGEARIYDQLEKYGPNLTVIPATNNIQTTVGSLNLGSITVGENFIPESMLPQLREITDGEIRSALKIEDEEDIATIAPRLYVGANLMGRDAILVGIDPEPERLIRSWWRVAEGEYLSASDEALLGAFAASDLGLAVGDQITSFEGGLRVVGILEETGSADDFQVFIPLATLQSAYQREGLVSAVDIRALCNACPVEIIADAVNQSTPGVRAVAVRQVADAEMALMDRMNRLMLALAGITIAIGLFGVVNTMMTSVHERVMDIGVMRAVGASRGQIMRLFLYESVAIGLLGGSVGYLLGTLLAYIIAPLIFDGTRVVFVGWYFPLALGISVAVSVLAAIYPAYRATRIKIAEAFGSL
jgi:putative ABC transport system permease protein